MNKAKSKNRKFILPIIVSLLIGGVSLSIWYFYFKSDATNSSTSTSYTTIEAKKGNISSTVSASGIIESANYLAVTTSVNGIVKKVFVKEGDQVVKGQKIMEITLNADGEEALVQARASYLSAKNSLQSAKNSLESKRISLIKAEQNFDDVKDSTSYSTEEERYSFKIAEGEYNTAQADYNQQKENITQSELAVQKAYLALQAQASTVVAPDSGTIANIVIVEGMEISNSLSERTSSSVASIKKEGTPIATFDVNELDIAKIQVGQKASMILNSVADKIFSGSVVGIDKLGSSSNGVTNYSVIVKFDEDSNAVFPNMNVDADIILEQKENIVYIPTAAIKSQRGEKYITKINGSQEEQVKIETGITDDENTEVISGLSEGDKVKVASYSTTGFTEAQNNNRSGATFRGPGF